MKKVIEHGYNRYHGKCSRCNCIFEYELVDVDNNGNVTCPDCGTECLHFNIEYILTSQIKEGDIW